ncbi:HAD family hydrolase [Paenibacillus allorhizosphaerae]|uniref:Phosphoglycolate phosphatase n=1 Tax=Paenibacillus allorhizosphaerae TaxID=2849866 RepID=A0ABM8VN99_9BACL|nr:HAD family phosphatase [Paenibacillus allorhizosphaerae]CAG7651136.1 Phosphoglycolate phosphatase [Paenibacillus allorhizosphaerae]
MQEDRSETLQHRLPRSVIRHIVFDLGGVFFIWPEPRYFEEWALRLGIASELFNRLLLHGPDIEAANVGMITAEQYYGRCAERLQVDESVVREIICHAFYSCNVDAKLVEYVGRLRKRYRVSALTNTWSFGRALIEQRGLAKLFDCIVTSAEEGIRKPDARIYDITLQRLDAAPAEVIFVDDTEENVRAAQAIGIHGVHFKGTDSFISEMEQRLERFS